DRRPEFFLAQLGAGVAIDRVNLTLSGGNDNEVLKDQGRAGTEPCTGVVRPLFGEWRGEGRGIGIPATKLSPARGPAVASRDGIDLQRDTAGGRNGEHAAGKSCSQKSHPKKN